MSAYEELVFEIPDGLLGPLWEMIVSVTRPDTVFYALWAYMLHHEAYYLESISYHDHWDEESREHDEILGWWVDAAYLEWDYIAAELRMGKTRNLAGTAYDPQLQTLSIILKERDFDEPYAPTDCPC